ncbi:MAG TPA: hypothetical protein VFA70_09425 [Dehalococcoidia bacterium]|nr:hypothetical protein [Dehalococcoidia bacterium]
MLFLAGFALILYGTLGCFRATELLRRHTLPVADCGATALLGVLLILSGLGLLLGSPIGVLVILLLAVWRALALYNAHLRYGRLRRRDVWPAAVPDLALAALVALGSH